MASPSHHQKAAGIRSDPQKECQYWGKEKRRGAGFENSAKSCAVWVYPLRGCIRLRDLTPSPLPALPTPKSDFLQFFFRVLQRWSLVKKLYLIHGSNN